MISTLRRYSRIYWVQVKNNFVREAVYRSNFFATIIVDLAWMSMEISLFAVIYANVPTLAGWTKYEVYFFLGILFASDALFTTFFHRNYFHFSDLVNRGELDLFLTKPAHPVFLILTRWINFTALFSFSSGVFIAYTFAEQAGFTGGIQWVFVLFWLGVGLVSAILLRFAFAVWIFWTDRNWAIVRLYFQCFSFATKPDPLYPKYIRYALLTVLPFGFIGSVPARALLHGLEAWEYFALLLSLTGLFILNTFLWRKGLRRYQSASS